MTVTLVTIVVSKQKSRLMPSFETGSYAYDLCGYPLLEMHLIG